MKKILLLQIILLGLLFASCYDNPADNPTGNLPPDTGLFLNPDSTISQQPSRLRVSWWGDDPDGLIAGFFCKWEGIDSSWFFTPSNDSIFSLPIGTIDTSFNFKVSAADDQGNGVYDTKIFQNGIEYGAEPFIDANGDGIYNPGEKFYDIGLIDPTPAALPFPIKNSTPTIEWNELTVLPDTSFPVMTFGWNADDLDGIESITSIDLALNDTTNFITLAGNVRLITLRTFDFTTNSPQMEILINGSEQNISTEKLSGIKLDDFNRIYIRATDISGSSSSFKQLPDTSKTWFVKKPKGKLLLVDDYVSSANDEAMVNQFYKNSFNAINGGVFIDKYEILDLKNTNLPYENVTFLQTLKMFNYIYWYSASSPRLDLLNVLTNKFVDAGGKIAFSMTFQDSSSSFAFDVTSLQGFLPIESLGQKKPISFLFSGDLVPSSSGVSYPQLKISSTVSSVRTFVPNEISAEKIYKITSTQLTGNIAFMTNAKNLFFIGLPLHQLNGGAGNVVPMLEKLFVEDFGYTP